MLIDFADANSSNFALIVSLAFTSNSSSLTWVQRAASLSLIKPSILDVDVDGVEDLVCET